MIKTTSLETSKLLKQLGFKQENLEYYWINSPMSKEDNFILCTKDYLLENFFYFTSKIPENWYEEYSKLGWTILAAPTTDEILEELKDSNVLIEQIRNQSIVECCKESNETIKINKTLVESLAEVWIWLKKEGLIK